MAKLRPTGFVALALLLLALSTSVNVLQARRIKTLVAGATAVGRVAPSISGVTIAGDFVNLATNGRTPTVVYYFSTTCTWCERNWPNVKALARESVARFRFVAVTDEPIAVDYLGQRDLKFEVITGISAGTKAGLGLRGTPHTVVISSEGIITHDWPGAYAPRLKARLEDIFQVTLPGLAANDAGAAPLQR
jgi:hypothetical protein